MQCDGCGYDFTANDAHGNEGVFCEKCYRLYEWCDDCDTRLTPVVLIMFQDGANKYSNFRIVPKSKAMPFHKRNQRWSYDNFNVDENDTVCGRIVLENSRKDLGYFDFGREMTDCTNYFWYCKECQEEKITESG